MVQLPITIVEARPDSADAVQLINELDEYLMGHPYTPESRHAFSVDKLVREGVAFFIARYEGAAAGCAGIKMFGNDYGEVKRMYVRPTHRGLGLGKLPLLPMAVTICRPFAILSVTDSFLRFSLILAMRFSSAGY